ncbi:hypothetical protein ACPB9E_26870 [Streptomyces exfoliatus]|uniref:hypothetical protein n=1 Tax=Streptomyces exfoliatus TaxID=1905 RepID=UPI003C2E1F65
MRLYAYLEWGDEAARHFSGYVTSRNIDRLVRTRMHQSLPDGVGHLAGSSQERLVNGLVAETADSCRPSLPCRPSPTAQ